MSDSQRINSIMAAAAPGFEHAAALLAQTTLSEEEVVKALQVAESGLAPAPVRSSNRKSGMPAGIDFSMIVYSYDDDPSRSAAAGSWRKSVEKINAEHDRIVGQTCSSSSDQNPAVTSRSFGRAR